MTPVCVDVTIVQWIDTNNVYFLVVSLYSTEVKCYCL